MSLSARERIQFELLTADLALDDSDLKKMAKRERLTVMSYMPLPSPRTILMALVVMTVCAFVASILTHNAILYIVNSALSVILTAVVLFSPADKFFTFYRKPKTEMR